MDLHDAQRECELAFADVAAAIGIPVSNLRGVRILYPELTTLPPDLPSAELRRQALFNRTDIIAALAAYAASEAALQLEIAKRYPDVRLSPGYKFDQGDNEWYLGLSIELPFLNQNQGPIAEAEARREEAAIRFNALQARVVAELDRNTAIYSTAQVKLETVEELLNRRSEQLNAAEARRTAGDVSDLEVVAVQIQAHESALLRLRTWVEVQQAHRALEQTLQSPVVPAPSLSDTTALLPTPSSP